MGTGIKTTKPIISLLMATTTGLQIVEDLQKTVVAPLAVQATGLVGLDLEVCR